MAIGRCLLFCFFLKVAVGVKFYQNVSAITPGNRQLCDFRRDHPKPIGLLTTTAGDPVDVRDTVLLNSDQFINRFHLDTHLGVTGERVPERVVHAKGTGAYGYLEVTNDITEYTYADLFSKVGKKTPVFARFSNSIPSRGGSDLLKELKGISMKIYTEEGNLDLLCLQTPVYFYRDPLLFAEIVHAFKKNPKTHLFDFTAAWDIMTMKPETIHQILWLQSDFGSPNGYRKMDVFPIHTYELLNKKGERFYVKFNFRTEQGLEGLSVAQLSALQAVDLDYYIRDLYDSIARKEFPSWRLEMDVLDLNQVKNLDYDPFDVTRMWRNGTYKTVQIGRLVINKHVDNHFNTAEQVALNPANLVPGIPGPVDFMFKARRVIYQDAQNYRVGRNHHKVDINLPIHAKTYLRDGLPPLRDNMRDAPNYYPNSYNGPVPYVDDKRPSEKLIVLHSNAVDLQNAADFYNLVLTNDTQRQRLVEGLVVTLVNVNPPVQERVIKILYLVDKDLGKRVDVALQAAILAAGTNQNRSTGTTNNAK